MFSDAKGIEAGLVRQFDLFEEVLNALDGTNCYASDGV